jgi:hypothetical protein
MRDFGGVMKALALARRARAAVPMSALLLLAGCASSPQKRIGAGSGEEAQRWLDAGGDLNSRDSAGATALQWAVFKGNLPVVQVFQKKGADLSKISISNAVNDGNLEMVRFLLDHGAPVDGLCATADGRPGVCPIAPLHWAAGYCKTAITELLVERGAELNPVSTISQGTYGWTPTDWALEDAVLGPIWRRGCALKLARYLISKGAVFRVRHASTTGDMMAAFLPAAAGAAALRGAARTSKVLKNLPTGALNGDTDALVGSPTTNPACGCPVGFPSYRDGRCYRSEQEACANAAPDCRAQTCR